MNPLVSTAPQGAPPQPGPQPANALAPGTGQTPGPQVTAPLALPPPTATPAQLADGIKAHQVAIANITQTLNNPSLLADPDRLQKRLLSSAADIYRIVKDYGPPQPLIAHAMDIMQDPRGPKVALQDRLMQALTGLSNLDMYARKMHGKSPLAPPPAVDMSPDNTPAPAAQGAQ